MRKLYVPIMMDPEHRVEIYHDDFKRLGVDHLFLTECVRFVHEHGDRYAFAIENTKKHVKIYEELGLRISKEQFRKLGVYGEPGRIAAYRDGSIWRMVIVVFSLDLPQEPKMTISSESKELRFFTKEEIRNIEIAVTHRDIVEDLFLNK